MFVLETERRERAVVGTAHHDGCRTCGSRKPMQIGFVESFRVIDSIQG
jgi:hypothetical protein